MLTGNNEIIPNSAVLAYFANMTCTDRVTDRPGKLLRFYNLGQSFVQIGWTFICMLDGNWSIVCVWVFNQWSSAR